MRKARTALARLRSPRSGPSRPRSLATNAAIDHHFSKAAETPSTAVQLPLPLATKNLLRASSDLAQRSVTNPDLWITSAQAAMDDLCKPRKPVVAFYGDAHSGARDIVTALLEDPLSDDQERRNALTGRHDGDTHSAKPLLISYDDQIERTDTSLKLRAPWLRSNFSVLEVPVGEHGVSGPLPALFTADHVILVTDNVRFLSQPHFASLVKAFSHHPSAQLLLNRLVTSSTTVHEDEAELGRQLTQLLYPEKAQSMGDGPPTIQVGTVSSTDALDALDIFRSTQSSPLPSAARAVSLDIYQRKSLNSALTSLSSRIATALQPPGQSSLASDAYYTQSATAAFLVSRILNACRISLSRAQSELSQTQNLIESLRTKALQDRFDLEAAFIGLDSSGKGTVVTRSVGDGELPVVTEEMARCESEARRVVRDWLSWWALLGGRVDDVGNIMRDQVVDDYGKELENKVVFLAGRLSSSQRDLSSLSTQLVTFPPSSPFHSPILTNTVAQQQQLEQQVVSRTSSTDLPLYTNDLLRPIHARREQLLTQLIPQLHSRAQSLMLQLYITTVASAGSAWAGWISGGIEWMTGDVAFGLGALGVVAGARWSVGRWEKAQRQFWKGWHRVGQGLSRDMKVSLDSTFDGALTKTPRIACDGLQELVDARAKGVVDVRLEHDALQDKLRKLPVR
ncbi:hypothetical protein FRB95_008369 [Tulasnella sp. JGI-2019a]|nr:hypothetical protein FRB95_008369 [Tulasnella sp. JGI-2019a]